MNPSGLAPFGEPQLRNHWGFLPGLTPNDVELYGYARTEEGFGSQAERDGGWFYDPPLPTNWETSWFGGRDNELRAKFVQDRIRQDESAYRMQLQGKGFLPQIASGFSPRGGSIAVERLNDSFLTDLVPLRFTTSSFDVDINGLGLIDEEFLGDRPQLSGGNSYFLKDFGYIPTTRGTSRLRYDSNDIHVRFARSESVHAVEFAIPELSNFSGDYGLYGQNFDSAQFSHYYVDMDYGGFISDDTLSFTGGAIRSNWQSPVLPLFSTTVLDLPGLLDLNAEGIDGEVNLRGFSRRGFANQFAPFRPLPSDQRFGRVASSEQQFVELPIQRPGVLRNMLSYAPGMQTSTADVLAVLDSESEPGHTPVRGKIDDVARRLIEKARAVGWETVTVLDDKNARDVTLACNGAGELRLERRTTDGLLEQVISDGKTLQHLYPEIGIGAKRTVTRFHRHALLSMTPWLLPPVEDLTIGCDIRQVNENTIRIMRIESPESDEQTPDDSKSAEGIELAIELVFNDDGKLSECRLIKLSSKSEPTELLLSRHLYEASGKIRILDKSDKLVTEVKLVRQPLDEPVTTPSIDGLVILPLPYRSADSYSLTLPAQPASNGSVDYSQLSEADAMKLVATHVATSSFDALWNVINQRFVGNDDCRMGFAVLLSGAATGNSQPIHEVASHNQGSSALGSFLVQHFDWWKDQGRNKEFVLPDSASPFLKQLVDTHNLFALWSSGRATQDRTEAQVNKELNRAIELIRNCRSRQLAWLLLNVVHKSIDETFSKKKLHLRLAKEAASFETEPGLFGPARYARVLWLISAGKSAEARGLYSSFRHDATTDGFTPAVSDEIRSAFKAASGDSKEWSRVILASAEPLVEQKRSFELLQLALQCAVIAEHDTALQLLEKGIAGVRLKERPDLLVVGLQCLITTDDWDRAEDFARQLINYGNAKENSALWRTASQIATALGNDDESLRRLEQAMRLEFSSLPDTVNVESLRADYNKLFDRFTTFADETIAKREPFSKDFVERVTQAADAWRSIDPDPTIACQRAARLLQLVGIYDDAWDYWTTPLVNTAGSSAAWRSLASALAETNQIHRASQAWAEAFAAEPTNPELLWNHATLLREHNQPERAKKLLTQIMNGEWQPRFANYKSKARSLLQEL